MLLRLERRFPSFLYLFQSGCLSLVSGFRLLTSDIWLLASNLALTFQIEFDPLLNPMPVTKTGIHFYHIDRRSFGGNGAEGLGLGISANLAISFWSLL